MIEIKSGKTALSKRVVESGFIKVSTSELQQNLKEITAALQSGAFVELSKYGRKIGMIVPY